MVWTITDEIAEELAVLLKHPLYHLNLIKYHTTGAFISSSKEQRFHFMDVLKARGVSVTHRITFGEDIDAACGQLANKVEQGCMGRPNWGVDPVATIMCSPLNVTFMNHAFA